MVSKEVTLLYIRNLSKTYGMLKIIACMIAGIGIGWLLRRHQLSFISKAITFVTWALLFSLGAEIGGNEELLMSFGQLGLEAAGVTIAAVAGSVLMAWLLWRYSIREKKGPRS